MKKKMLLVCGALLAAMVVAAGCGESGALSGTYKLSGAEYQGQQISGEQLDAVATLIGVDMGMSLTFSGEDKFTLHTSIGANGSNTSSDIQGTYQLDGETLSLTVEGDTETVQFKDGKIYMDMGAGVLIFSK